MLWKEIKGFSLYDISEEGQIRRSEKDSIRVGRQALRRPKGHVFTPNISQQGYLQIRLTSDDPNVPSRVHKVHHLVAEAFLESRPSKKHFVLHKDDNKNNNATANLYWGTKKQNALDRSKNGKCGRSKLSAKEVKLIRVLCKESTPIKDIAKMYKISYSTTVQIIRRKTYVWVP